MTHKRFGTVFRPSMIKFNENFCDIVGNKSYSFLAIQLRKMLSTSITNFLEPCPLMVFNSNENLYFIKFLIGHFLLGQKVFIRQEERNWRANLFGQFFPTINPDWRLENYYRTDDTHEWRQRVDIPIFRCFWSIPKNCYPILIYKTS